jgi:hypothetical protein
MGPGVEWNAPWAKWFAGGEINLRTTASRPAREDVEEEQGSPDLGERTGRGAHYTYQQLWKKCKFANVLSRWA